MNFRPSGKPGKPGLASFSETLVLFFIQFLSFRKMKVQDRQICPSKSFRAYQKKLAGYEPGLCWETVREGKKMRLRPNRQRWRARYMPGFCSRLFVSHGLPYSAGCCLKCMETKMSALILKPYSASASASAFNFEGPWAQALTNCGSYNFWHNDQISETEQHKVE